MRFPVRTELIVGEGPLGFALRFAQANGHSRLTLNKLGFEFDHVVLLDWGCISPTGTDTRIDEQIARILELNCEHVLNTRNARYCPLCIAEQPYWKLAWELLFVDSCVTHGVWLVDTCNACGAQLTWNRARLLQCDCGAPLRAQPTKPSPFAVNMLSKLLEEKAAGNYAGDSSSVIGNMTVKQIQRLIRFLGAYTDPLAGPRPQKIVDVGALSTSWRLSSLAAEVLSNWPTNYLVVLKQLQQQGAPDAAGRLPGTFGYFYALLYRAFTEPEFESLRAVFEDFIAENWSGAFARRNRRLITSVLPRMAWVPASHACATLGVSRRRLIDLIKNGCIAGKERISLAGRRYLVVRRTDVDLVRPDVDNEIDLKAASHLLGLSKRRMQHVLTLLFPSARKTGEASCPWAISKAYVDEILSVGHALPQATQWSSSEVSMVHVLQFWAWTDDDVVTLLRSAINGAIRPSRVNVRGAGIGAWIFETSTLRNWYAQRPKPETSLMTIPEAAKCLGIKQEVAYFLVRNGFLNTVVSRSHGKSAANVGSEELDRFNSTYAFARSIAHALRTSSRSLIQTLSRNGIRPVSGPDIDGSRQVLYFKNDEFSAAVDAIGARAPQN